MMLCDIVVPIWDQPERTRRCLDSVLRHTPEPARLILIDNGSQKPTQDLLEEFRKKNTLPVRIIRNPENLGFIKAVNQGIRASTSPWVCLLNNDTVVTAGWLGELIRIGGSEPDIGLVNPTSNSLGFHAGKVSLDEYAASLKSQSGRWTPLTTALGFCLLARRNLFEKIGFLDESFGMGYFEDDDLSRRVRTAGLRCVRACGSYIYHEEQASFRHLPGTAEAFRKNREIFESRWGRRLRILWLASQPNANGSKNPAQTILDLSREGHWLYLAGPPGTIPNAVRSQAQISIIPLRSLWRLKILGRLLAKRKKPFDLMISDDPFVSAWAKKVSFLHHAKLLESPELSAVSEECRRLAGQGKS